MVGLCGKRLSPLHPVAALGLLGADTASDSPAAIRKKQVVVRVPVDAFSKRPVAATSAPRVLIVREHAQVLDVDASTALALVVNGHALGYLAVGMDPCGTVCRDHLPIVAVLPPDLCVAVGGDGVGADVAPALINDEAGGRSCSHPLRDDDLLLGSPVPAQKGAGSCPYPPRCWNPCPGCAAVGHCGPPPVPDPYC